jgi:hypothetical protein
LLELQAEECSVALPGEEAEKWLELVPGEEAEVPAVKHLAAPSREHQAVHAAEGHWVEQHAEEHQVRLLGVEAEAAVEDHLAEPEGAYWMAPVEEKAAEAVRRQAKSTTKERGPGQSQPSGRLSIHFLISLVTSWKTFIPIRL